MPMNNLEICLEGPNASVADELASLHDWLRKEKLAGVRIERAQGTPVPGQMGVDPLTALSIFLGSKAAVELFTSVAAWIKYRRPRVSLKIKTKAGSVEIDAENLGGLDGSIERALSLLDQQK